MPSNPMRMPTEVNAMTAKTARTVKKRLRFRERVDRRDQDRPVRHGERRRMRRLAGLGAVVLLAASAAYGPVAGALAQRPEDTGFPFELPEIFSEENVSVEINLPRFLLAMVAKATAGETDDDDFSKVIAGLQEIKVRIAEVEEGLPKNALDEIRDAAGSLDRQGWYPLMRVRQEDESFYIYLWQQGETVNGVVVLFADPTEAGLIHIRGTVDPEELGRLGATLDLPGLSEAIEKHPLKKVEEEP
jgi:hypothetical protein